MDELSRLRERVATIRDCAFDRLRDGSAATSAPSPAEVYAGALLFINGAARDALTECSELPPSQQALDVVMYHLGDCAHPALTFEEMFAGGDLLHHAQALRESATGSGEPLRHPEIVREYVARRLREWKSPSDFWDNCVRDLCEYALREYHALAPHPALPPSEKET